MVSPRATHREVWLAEFQTAEKIRLKCPDGVHGLADGGTCNTLAGRSTDDSKMALLLARMPAKRGDCDKDAVICGRLLGAVYGLQSVPSPDVPMYIGRVPSVSGPRTHLTSQAV